eukprot:TRINITY_DN121107_c1_g1_i1.p1 TRINITY_DN121107_c1_g1~~TRINITY_DN121107_c1_g1_i1.p1  ORF type:complete len:633 (+),score=81.69 TRINITY_DN121107_c1_g1_i1:1552-3450(+)
MAFFGNASGPASEVAPPSADRFYAFDRIRDEFVRKYGPSVFCPIKLLQFEPQIEATLNALVPGLLKEGKTYKEIMSTVNTELYNTFMQQRLESAREPIKMIESKPETGEKRPLPLNPKASTLVVANKIEVIDEWGAVFQHQAEVDQQLREEEKLLLREKQRRYKEELDRQKQLETEQKARKNLKDLEKSSKTSIPVVEGEAFFNETKERRKILNSLLQQRIKENEEQFQAERARKQAERDLLYKLNKEQHEAEQREKLTEKMRRQQMAKALSSSYAEQVMEKRRALESEKQMDRLMIEKNVAKPGHNDVEVLKVLTSSTITKQHNELINRATEAVSKKEQMYKRVVHESLEREQRKLEDWYSRSAIEKQQKERELEMISSERKLRDKELMNKILFQQIQEKIEREKQKKQQEQEIQQYLKRDLEETTSLEKMKRDNELQRKVRYSELLRQQIEENSRKKAEIVRMSEMERKLNMKDLQAYEYRMPMVHAKVPGLPTSPGMLKSLKCGPPSSKDSCSTRHESLLGKAGSLAINALGSDPRTIIESRRKAGGEGSGAGNYYWNSFSKVHSQEYQYYITVWIIFDIQMLISQQLPTNAMRIMLNNSNKLCNYLKMELIDLYSISSIFNSLLANCC